MDLRIANGLFWLSIPTLTKVTTSGSICELFTRNWIGHEQYTKSTCSCDLNLGLVTSPLSRYAKKGPLGIRCVKPKGHVETYCNVNAQLRESSFLLSEILIGWLQEWCKFSFAQTALLWRLTPGVFKLCNIKRWTSCCQINRYSTEHGRVKRPNVCHLCVASWNISGLDVYGCCLSAATLGVWLSKSFQSWLFLCSWTGPKHPTPLVLCYGLYYQVYTWGYCSYKKTS